MGSFTNDKKPCPVCGNATPRLLPDKVEGIPICKECAKKKDVPDQIWKGMTMETFREYIAFHQENQPLREQFENTCFWYDIYMDLPKHLFRLDGRSDALVMEASCIKSFRILEGDNVLFESSPEGLKCYETDVPARIQAAAPAISVFNMEYARYQQLERMRASVEENGDDKGFPHIDEPRFYYPVIHKGLRVELTLEHPYWGGTHSWSGPTPAFSETSPSIDDFLRQFEREMKQLHELAVNLMNLLGLDATEIRVPG